MLKAATKTGSPKTPAKVGNVRVIGTASHVCEILNCFNAQRSTLSLTEVAQTIGLKPSSVYQLLKTLALHDYLTYDDRTRRYGLGGNIARLVGVYRVSNSLVNMAMPYLNALREMTTETSALQIRVNDTRYCVAQLLSTYPMKMVLEENHAYPLKHEASSLVLRAFSSDWQTQKNRSAIERVRKDGFAVGRGTVHEGAVAIYAPVLDGAAIIMATIGIHGPAIRITDRVLAQHTRAVVSAAKKLSAQIEVDLRF